MLVTIQNAYAAANVTVETGQTLVSGGAYSSSGTPCTSET